jgi:hypothetical protein
MVKGSVRGLSGFSSIGQQGMFSWNGMMRCDRVFDHSGRILLLSSCDT